MKIITRAVMDWDGNILEEDSFDYAGPVAACKSSGSAPQPIDPYQQAGAQYGLATGTANYNAALNRTNSYNPLGSSTWNITGYDGSGAGGIPGTNSGGATPPSMSTGTQGNPNGNIYGIFNGGAGGGTFTPGIGGGYNVGGASSLPGVSSGRGGGSGAPRYSQQTSLTPWANQMLSSPIDTAGLAGMPGGPSTTQDLSNTRNALYGQEMGYLAPQFQQQQTSMDAQLAAEGATPGSEAWKNSEGNLGRQQTFANNQAINSAITGGGQEQSRLFSLGSQALQNQLAVRNAPISEYEQLQGNGSGGQISAATPDISGAFGQQYQGQLAGYNASTATDNANTSTIGSLAAMAALYF